MSFNLENSRLYRRLRYAKHGVIIFVGTGQWGKTVSMHALLNSPLFASRSKAMVNYPKKFVTDYLPPEYRACRWPEDLQDFPKIFKPSRDCVVIDDAVFFAGARDHATKGNKDVQKMLTIASHNELFFFLTIQSMGLLDFSLLQSQDVYIFHKNMDVLSMQFERPEFRSKQLIANLRLDSARDEYPELEPKGFSYCSTTYELIYNSLPSYWSPRLSKPFYGVVP